MNKVVYSQWSKPSKDECIGFRSKQAFANCAELSVLNSRKWFDNVELVTDEKGYKFLIEDLKLPFTNVKVELDRLNNISNEHWSIGKLYACSIQDKPFMHQDFDVIWFKKPPNRVLNAQAAFQELESDKGFHGYYRPLMDDAKINNYELNKYCNLDELAAYNCGVICFNDLSITSKWYDLAMDYIRKSKKNINLKPIFFEQFLIYNLCKYYDFNVETISEKKYFITKEDSIKYGYTHLISQSKRKPDVEELVAKKLKKHKLFFTQNK
jgi:hypothetical protein